MSTIPAPTGRFLLLGALIALSGGADPALAQIQIVLDDTTVPVTQCNELWTDSDVHLRFVPGLADDFCQGACWFMPTPTDVALAGRLQANVSDVPGLIESAEVDLISWCSPGCTRVFLYDGGGAIVDSASVPSAGALHTMLLVAGPNLIEEVAVSSCEGTVYAIRLNMVQSVGVEVTSAAEGLEVGPARPNPFHVRTGISFRIAESRDLRVAVYDVRGALVRTLLERQMPAGTHEAFWDGRADDGRAAPAGVYFYEVRADRNVRRGKIVRTR